MKLQKAEEWEQNHINSLTLKCIFAAAIGTALAAGIAFLLQRMYSIQEIPRELLFMPWGIALVLGISIAFRRGVMAERARASGKDSK